MAALTFDPAIAGTLGTFSLAAAARGTGIVPCAPACTLSCNGVQENA